MPDQNHLLRGLSAPVLDKVKSRLRHHDFSAGQILFVAGDKIGSMYFLVSGAVSLVTELSGGQMIESGLVGHDGVVGGGAALDDCDAMCKAIVQIAGKGYTLDVDSARHIARESEEFRTAIIRHDQLVLAQAQQSAACNATHTLNQRMARWLLRACDATGTDAFELTQEFMAEMLGVRRTSVSIVAHALQEAGLISYRRGHVKIEKLDALRQVACECYGTIKMRYDTVLSNQATNVTLGNAPTTAASTAGSVPPR